MKISAKCFESGANPDISNWSHCKIFSLHVQRLYELNSQNRRPCIRILTA